MITLHSSASVNAELRPPILRRRLVRQPPFLQLLSPTDFHFRRKGLPELEVHQAAALVSGLDLVGMRKAEWPRPHLPPSALRVPHHVAKPFVAGLDP